jgi:hypothetical protein
VGLSLRAETLVAHHHVPACQLTLEILQIADQNALLTLTAQATEPVQDRSALILAPAHADMALNVL